MAGAESEDWGGLSALEGTSEVVDNTFFGQHDSGDTPLLNYTEPVSDPSPPHTFCRCPYIYFLNTGSASL